MEQRTRFVGSNVPVKDKPMRALVRHVEGWGEVKVLVQGDTVWLLRPDNVWDVMMPFLVSDGAEYVQVQG